MFCVILYYIYDMMGRGSIFRNEPHPLFRATSKLIFAKRAWRSLAGGSSWERPSETWFRCAVNANLKRWNLDVRLIYLGGLSAGHPATWSIGHPATPTPGHMATWAHIILLVYNIYTYIYICSYTYMYI